MPQLLGCHGGQLQLWYSEGVYFFCIPECQGLLLWTQVVKLCFAVPSCSAPGLWAQMRCGLFLEGEECRRG
jgi:hypothetical protein